MVLLVLSHPYREMKHEQAVHLQTAGLHRIHSGPIRSHHLRESSAFRLQYDKQGPVLLQLLPEAGAVSSRENIPSTLFVVARPVAQRDPLHPGRYSRRRENFLESRLPSCFGCCGRLLRGFSVSFGQRLPITRGGVDYTEPIAKPEFTTLEKKSRDSVEKNRSLTDQVAKTLNISGPVAEKFSLRVEKPSPIQQELVRERFVERPVSSTDEDKLSRILRLIEQNRTGYERPAVQDMVLYIFTGVFFLFTFDTFVLLGKSMRKVKA
jgi:hypothetical protein